jgi:hypothetical protein
MIDDPWPEKSASTYLVNRFDQYVSWYDAKAVKMKKYYLRAKLTAATASVLVPILAQLEWTLTTFTYSFSVGRLLTTLLGGLVAILLALEGVLHHREQWRNYRTTEQYLRAERVFFENRLGDYAGLNDEEALRNLIAKVETAIKDENELTLNVLTRSTSPIDLQSDRT